MVTTVAQLIAAPVKTEIEKTLVRRFSLAEFMAVAEALPNDKLELIDGEIVFMPPPTEKHMDLADRVVELFGLHTSEIIVGGGRISGSRYYARPADLPAEWVEEDEKGSSHVCPDASIRRLAAKEGEPPPAFLVVEVLSLSKKGHIDRDLETKPKIYAALEIPVYWVVDRRDQSVIVHTQPGGGDYKSRVKCQGDDVLSAPGLEFLQITPAQIFEASP